MIDLNHYARAEARPDALYLTSQTVDTIIPEPDMATARAHARRILSDNPTDSFVEIYSALGTVLEVITR